MLYLTYSVVWGMGASFVYFADLLILTKYFKVRLAFANVLMALGGAVGELNPSMQQMFIHFGLANMFRVLSFQRFWSYPHFLWFIGQSAASFRIIMTL